MKLFEMPYIDVLKFAVKDVIATSSDEDIEDLPPEAPAPGLGCI